MEGQAEKQPAESVDTLSGIADLLDGDPAETETEDELDEGESEEEEGEEPEEESEESDAEEAEFTIKHDGKDITLKQSELLEMAQKGFDYTNKTMALAEERKQLEPVREKAKEALAHYENTVEQSLHRLRTYSDFIESELGTPPGIDLAQYDAQAYLVQKEAYESRVAKLRNAYGQIEQLEQERNHVRQSELLDRANQTEKYLTETLPGWKDAPEKSLQELNSYLIEHGLTPESAREAYVAKGLWEIAHKAREYDKIKAAQSQLKPKANLPRVSKPSANPQPANIKRQEALKRFNAKPSIDTLAGLM
jgi:small-conductance mechanosensitive channel